MDCKINLTLISHDHIISFGNRLILGMGNSELSILLDTKLPIDTRQSFFSKLNEKAIYYDSFSIDMLR